MEETYYLFLLLALIAEILGTVSGFGSSLLFVPMATLFFDFKTVLGVTAIFHVFSNLSKIALFRKGIQKEIALKLGIPAVLSVLVGAFFTTFLPTTYMELTMNIVLILLSIYLIRNFDKPIPQSNTNLYLGGISSGFIAGFAGTGGAIRGITLAAFHLPKDIFIATSAIIDLGVDTGRAAVYLSQGYFESRLWVLIPFLIGVSFVGSYIGKIILQKTSENVFRYLVLIIITASALWQIIRIIIF